MVPEEDELDEAEELDEDELEDSPDELLDELEVELDELLLAFDDEATWLMLSSGFAIDFFMVPKVHSIISLIKMTKSTVW